MTDNPFAIDWVKQAANSLEWEFTIFKRERPWPVEEGMTQTLAHESAEGFSPRLAVVAEHHAKVIHELGSRNSAAAVAALRAFEAMSPIDTQREMAGANANRIVRQGQPEPPWLESIGRVRVDDCWWSHDEFGESALIVCAFSYDGEDAHAIVMMVDLTLGGGMVRELTLTMDPAVPLALVREAHGGEECLVSEALDPALGRRLFEDAIATSDELSENEDYHLRPVPQAYRKMRALVLARARALADVAAPAETLPGSVEVELLKRSFLASPAAAALPAGDAIGRALDLLVTQFLDQAACHPLALGPRRVQAILGLPRLAAEVRSDSELNQVFADVARAWIGWSASERGLSQAATDRLTEVARVAAAPLNPIPSQRFEAP